MCFFANFGSRKFLLYENNALKFSPNSQLDQRLELYTFSIAASQNSIKLERLLLLFHGSLLTARLFVKEQLTGGGQERVCSEQRCSKVSSCPSTDKKLKKKMNHYAVGFTIGYLQWKTEAQNRTILGLTKRNIVYWMDERMRLSDVLFMPYSQW